MLWGPIERLLSGLEAVGGVRAPEKGGLGGPSRDLRSLSAMKTTSSSNMYGFQSFLKGFGDLSGYLGKHPEARLGLLVGPFRVFWGPSTSLISPSAMNRRVLQTFTDAHRLLKNFKLSGPFGKPLGASWGHRGSGVGTLGFILGPS